MNEIFDETKQLPESPTFRAITTGRSKIFHVGNGDFTQWRVIEGAKWFGQSHQYEVVITDPNQPNGERVHYLTVWTPTGTDESGLRPDMQIYILGNGGEIVFTNKREEREKVLDEIDRQMNPPKEENEHEDLI